MVALEWSLGVNSPVAEAPSGLAGQESERFRLLISSARAASAAPAELGRWARRELREGARAGRWWSESSACLGAEGELFIQAKRSKIQQGALTSAEINEGRGGLFNLGNE